MSVSPRSAARLALLASSAILLVVGIAVCSVTRARPTASADPGQGKCPTTAAATHDWGTPNRSEDFTNGSSLAGWDLYDSVGNEGNGRRTPSAAFVADGLLTITGDAQGNSEGMAWQAGQMYGRWEVCVRSTPAPDGYHSVLLLWPDSENWPSDGEVDFMEITDPSRQSVEFWLHYGPDNSDESGGVQIDATQWHAWAVEWTPHGITAYVDGNLWFETTNTRHLPPGPMHMTIQLDNFGGDLSGGAQMQVDWARQYPV
jgi:Glycosyl hydrolases family 16